jgi:hypothetical protein
LEAFFKIKNKSSKLSEKLGANSRVIFGRGTDSQLTISDAKISGVHCQIIFKWDRMELVDLNSKNGTYLNGIRIEQAEIYLGDEIRIGDTLITFDESMMDKRTIDFLTFPGPHKDRINYELKADFTGARIQNQLYIREHHGESNSILQAREIDLRKKAHSKIRLSKKEIKSNNKVLTLLSLMIDFTLLLSVIFLPIIFIENLAKTQEVRFALWNLPSGFVTQNKTLLIAIFELFLISVFMVLNTKILKFSIGEKLMGIEDLYTRQ